MEYYGVHTDHIAIRTSSYQGIDQRSPIVRVHAMNYVVDTIRHDDRLLLVDDVFDTGRTIARVIEELTRKARRNTPKEIRVVVTYYKPSRNQTARVPEYFVHETERWIKFPHSLEGLSLEEIAAHRPSLHAVLRKALRVTDQTTR